MLQLLYSLFGGSDKPGSYPESLVKAAIERAVDGTDPWLRAVSGYKKKLRPAVVRAIDHVVALVDGLSPPLGMAPGSLDSDPRLLVFFVSVDDAQKLLDSDRSLAEFRKEREGAASRTVALLAMEKQERAFFGAALAGEIIVRDVAQVSVGFGDHRLLDPAASEDETRRLLKRRAFDHLLSLALRRITGVKQEREHLERYRTLLQSKLDLLQRGGWGFDRADAASTPDVAGVEENLRQIEAQLLELGRDDQVLEVYLEIVSDVLGRPGEHLWAEKETLIVDRMGIRRTEVGGDAMEVTLEVLRNAEGRSLVVSLVELSG